MFVDQDWQEHAESNAAKGFPWAVWGTRDGLPLSLLASKESKAEADRFAAHERSCLRPRGQWTVIVTFEGST